METLYFSINPDPETLLSGHLVYFALYSAIVIFIGFALAHLVRRWQRREAALLGRPPGRRWPGILLGAMVAGPILLYLYFDCWGHFFQVRLGDDRLTLDYFFPRRTVVLPADRVGHLAEPSEFRKGGNQYRILITTTDGKTFSSQLCYRDTLQANRRRIEAFLAGAP